MMVMKRYASRPLRWLCASSRPNMESIVVHQDGFTFGACLQSVSIHRLPNGSPASA
ncbi:hypothetical protein HETIRDRAFT_309421 [Heterobasidion irregulare TC 32-1]|uniref:Uncharacterized protein n=1 Tax=Heterobasidion irregulare (strain TC 32-1) TaxID=747525 RepID=W4KKG0_HETIT|nr:uncharacterized protein HETIRDRAFT_309421 [Heterobasidion irregulare TC 32-1]ETW86209.1 hypothetical protein HETIRDRAFT_309421 [Heterobasidion irregulare TC 32-1]